MLCPKCKKELITVERNQIELDYCIFCNGFWFDNGEWDILSEKLILEKFTENIDIYSIKKAISKEEIRKCPVCGCNMEKFLLYDNLLDRCPNKHGVWFDKKEFSRCANQIKGQNGAKKQIEFLGEVFNVE